MSNQDGFTRRVNPDHSTHMPRGQRISGAASPDEMGHTHRYCFARDLAVGLEVVHIASDGGSGAAILASAARRVVSVMRDATRLERARSAYKMGNLTFEAGDAFALPFSDGSQDMVVCFEALRQLARPEVFLKEMKRVLRPGGLLVIGTADLGMRGSPGGGEALPYDALAALIDRYFANASLHEQRILVASAMMGEVVPQRLYQQEGDATIEAADGLLQATHLIGVASDIPLPMLPSSLYVNRSSKDVPLSQIAALRVSRCVAAADLAVAWKPKESLSSELREAKAEIKARQAELKAERSLRAEFEQLLRTEQDEARATFLSQREEIERAVQAEQRASALLAELHGSRAVRIARAGTRAYGRMPRPIRRVLGACARRAFARHEGRRFRQHAALLAGSPLFDAEWYRATYPDVAAAGIDPSRHYLSMGWTEGRDPGPGFSSHNYLAANPDVAAAGMNPLLHYLLNGQAEGRPLAPRWIPGSETLAQPVRLSTTPVAANSSVERIVTAALPSARSLLSSRFNALEPMRCYPVPTSRPRLSVLTDSIGPSSLFGGVGTALLLGTLLANRLNATLRIVTRTEAPDAAPVRNLLGSNGIVLDGPLEVAFAGVESPRDLPIAENDLFLTTSWWTTRVALGSVPRKRIAYLLQEDERMFYPYGDERLRCSETMAEPDLPIVVNSELLFRHLVSGTEPFRNIERNGIWFEPAFPGAAVTPERGKRRKLFFYARPNNLRNLFWRGMEALDAAVAEGLFPPGSWEIHWAGKDIPEVALARGIVPVRAPALSWAEYQSLIASMDAGFVLMDTPHPSYPPLDLAAMGAAVLTNTHPGKTDMARYSDNILTAPPTQDGLLNGLRQLQSLAENDEARARNRAADRIGRDWAAALEPVVGSLVTRLAGG